MLSQDLLTCLSRNQFFKGIDQKNLKLLDESLFQIKQYHSEDVFIKEGTIGDEMFLIVEGTVQVSKKLPSGEEMTISQHRAGEFLGELALITETNRSASVSCLTDAQLIVIKKKAFFSITASIPHLLSNVAQIIAERLCSSDDRSASEVGKSLALLQLNKKISEQKNELEELNATKDKFFSIIAHDLKNPFNSLLGFSNLLIEGFDQLSKEDIHKFVSNIHVSADNLFKLLNNLLQWSQAQTGRIEYNPKKSDLYSIVNSNISLLTPSAEEKQVRLVSNVSENTFACFDENMITTVCRNLINNAIKFTNPGGEIRVESTLSGGFIELAVIDSGVGIKQSDARNLFIIDVKHSTTGTSGEKGTGLGLILCKEFVERHGGRIWVESELEKGSKFKFTLPEANDMPLDKEKLHDTGMDDNQITPDKRPESFPSSTELLEAEKKDTEITDFPSRILYADDDDNNHMIAKLYLKNTPVKLDTTENGELAVEKFKSENYNLVIMDMQMPVMDGFEATRQIRSFEKNKGVEKIPVIALSGFSSKKEIQRSLDAGCSDHLTKPITQDELIDMISKYTKPKV